MAFVIADRVRETTTTAGTGNLTLAGAVSKFRTFASVLSSSDTTYYSIVEQTGTDWEVGIGTFTSPSTLARTTILSSSNSGSAVNFAAGIKDVFITLPASKTNVEDQPNLIEVNSSSDALRITQTGTGNALVVEDSANPDATPFVIDASGNVGIGTSSPDALLTVNTIASFGAGAAATPSIAAKGDLNTGVFFPAADTVAVATGGAEKLRVASAGQIGIGGANYGTSGQVLTSGGPSAAPSWAAVTSAKAVDYQVFDSSGTWTKPSGYGASARVFVQAFGGGGSGGKEANAGGRAGGGGGGYSEKWVSLSTLGATETITIGAGGAAVSGTSNGNNGGTTSVGSVLSAYGGGGGSAGNGGGGGGQFTAGSNTGAAGSVGGGGGGASGSSCPPPTAGGGALFGGGGGGGSGNGVSGTAGGAALYGGGGGGGGSSSAGGAGGSSINGGAGGAGGTSNSGTAGSAPGGGGGGTRSGSTSGAGAAGRVIITVFDGA
jgi:hypothetical protein